MNKKPVEPDEMRMPADQFDEIMGRALGVPPPTAQPKRDDGSDKGQEKKGRPKKPR